MIRLETALRDAYFTCMIAVFFDVVKASDKYSLLQTLHSWNLREYIMHFVEDKDQSFFPWSKSLTQLILNVTELPFTERVKIFRPVI